jgi:hypothetical protein
MVPEVGDSEFPTRLEKAHEKALARADTVRNMDGLLATLSEFANAMGDGHIWSYAYRDSPIVRWAGVVIAKRGPRWVVHKVAPELESENLVGAQLLSCDGTDADTMANVRLRFYADLNAEFEVVKKAQRLLLDDGNPFVQPPSTCDFEQAGKRRTIALKWMEINWEEYKEKYQGRFSGQAGFGVRRVGGGYWVSLEQLNPKAQPVIDAVREQRTALQAAPFVVLDLRGNGGGNSLYADAIMKEIFGETYFKATTGDDENGDDCEVVFRASEGNIEGLAEIVETMGEVLGIAAYTEAIAKMKRSLAEGKALTGDPNCARQEGPNGPRTTSAAKGRTFVLTDVQCFSSCLIAVKKMTKLGAVQIGTPTAFETNYSEVREITLPSGVATFSTLQAILMSSPSQFGPFTPRFTFEGDISDTLAVERWFMESVLKGK